MKVTSQQFRKIVREELTRHKKTRSINEYGEKYAERAQGIYADVEAWEDLIEALEYYYDNTLQNAQADLGAAEADEVRALATAATIAAVGDALGGIGLTEPSKLLFKYLQSLDT